MDYTNQIILRGKVKNLRRTTYGYYFQLVQDKYTHRILWYTKGNIGLMKDGCPVKVDGELRYDTLTIKDGSKRVVPRIHTNIVQAFG